MGKEDKLVSGEEILKILEKAGVSEKSLWIISRNKELLDQLRKDYTERIRKLKRSEKTDKK